MDRVYMKLPNLYIIDSHALLVKKVFHDINLNYLQQILSSCISLNMTIGEYMIHAKKQQQNNEIDRYGIMYSQQL